MVDQASPEIVVGRANGDRLGLKYRDGEPMELGTASGGNVQGRRIQLASVRIGDVEVRDVEATIEDRPVPMCCWAGLSRRAFSGPGTAARWC